jgi:glyoxylase-like metal-dependent hydrolase (beta-lactamase superfamily II)
MGRRTKVGELEIIALNDGINRLPPMFFPGLDAAAHPELLDEDGTIHCPIGCFLIRGPSSTTLVDAGFGPTRMAYPEGMPPARAKRGSSQPFLAEGGRLPVALADVGCSPDEIDTVFLTHLHPDHVGWVAKEGRPFFERATVVFGEADWEPLIASAPKDDRSRIGMEAVAAAKRVKPIAGDMVPIAPGVTARHAPGHTPGHYVLVISSGTERAFLLGDAVQCPLQLTEGDIGFLSDVDRAMAARTREALFRELENQDVGIGMDHFPGLEFQRILRGQGRQWVVL